MMTGPEEYAKMNRQDHYEAIAEVVDVLHKETVAPTKLSRSDLIKMKHDLMLCRTFINESLEALEGGLSAKNWCKNCS